MRSTSGKPSKSGATQSSSRTSTRAPGRKRRSAWSEGVASTVSPIERRRTTSTRRTFVQSQRAGASGLASSTPASALGSPTTTSVVESGVVEVVACARVNAPASACLPGLLILDCRLFDDHGGYVVADGINAAAFETLDAARVLLQHDLAAAGRADDLERLDEVRRDCQLFMLLSSAPRSSDAVSSTCFQA